MDNRETRIKMEKSPRSELCSADHDDAVYASLRGDDAQPLAGQSHAQDAIQRV
mgnify:CR=1 FL=1